MSECHKPTLPRGITAFLSRQLTFYGRKKIIVIHLDNKANHSKRSEYYKASAPAIVEFNVVSENQDNGGGARVTFRYRHGCSWWMASGVAARWQQVGSTQLLQEQKSNRNKSETTIHTHTTKG
jgi:hypothetical protein